jgi:phospholipase/lecithinase/hemolysin
VQLRRFIVFSLFLILSAAAIAAPFTSVIVYGDSLSDNGNLYTATGQPGPPYWMGRHSNGPMAVEYLATAFGSPLIDLAWIGATTGLGNYGDGGTATTVGPYGLPGMATEFALSKTSVAPAAATSLFVIWGGPNDFLSPAPEDGGDPKKTADRAVADLLTLVSDVRGLGATRILVPGMPDLGLTPFFQSMGMGPEGSFLTDYFNAELRAGLPPGVTYFDTAAVLRQMVANPAAYGFTDVTDPCYIKSASAVCAAPDNYLFFDDFHPSTHASQIIGDKFAAAMVPEPATCLFVVTGVALILTRARIARRLPDRRRRTS